MPFKPDAILYNESHQDLISKAEKQVTCLKLLLISIMNMLTEGVDREPLSALHHVSFNNFLLDSQLDLLLHNGRQLIEALAGGGQQAAVAQQVKQH